MKNNQTWDRIEGTPHKYHPFFPLTSNVSWTEAVAGVTVTPSNALVFRTETVTVWLGVPPKSESFKGDTEIWPELLLKVIFPLKAPAVMAKVTAVLAASESLSEACKEKKTMQDCS